MRVFYLLILILISFQSCSTISNDDMIAEEEQMEMEEEMSNSSLLSGDFISDAHVTSGKASVNEDKTTLSFSNFKTDEGPLLEIYLATDTSASAYISLGAIKGVNGNYDYTLPNNVDLEKYDYVLIWCVTFSVNFGYTVLK